MLDNQLLESITIKELENEISFFDYELGRQETTGEYLLECIENIIQLYQEVAKRMIASRVEVKIEFGQPKITV